MFPTDLNGLFPHEMGQKNERVLRIKGKELGIILTCLSPSLYGIIIIDTKTNAVYLQRQNISEDVAQYNWKLFREGGFQKMP